MNKTSEVSDNDSLFRDFESQIHADAVFGAGAGAGAASEAGTGTGDGAGTGATAELDLRKFLQERDLTLPAEDPRLERLLELQLRHQIGRTARQDTDILLNTLVSWFPNLKPEVIVGLAALEWQLRREVGDSLDLEEFVGGVSGLNDSHRKELEKQLKHFASLAPPIQVAGADDWQYQTGDRVGVFRIIRRISHGGMGEVYYAEQLQPIRRHVALKLIRQHAVTSTSSRLLFQAECQAQAMMDHPHIATVYEAGVTEDGQPYVAMEYVSGSPLLEFCRKGRLSVAERLRVFLQTCRAIQYAHQQGIIHRDITPRNVLVADSNTGPVAQVIDFGLAKALHPDIVLADQPYYSVAGGPVGTFLYMSPEQTGHGPKGTDVRTDVYSLGAVLYQLLTGTTPINDPMFFELEKNEQIEMVCGYEPPPPSLRLRSTGAQLPVLAADRQTNPRQLIRQIHGDLDTIVLKALELDRERRYASVADLADDIERFLTQRPIQARPPSTVYRFRKAMRRHRVATFVVSVLLIGSVISLSALYSGWKSDQTRQLEEQRRILAETESLKNMLKAEDERHQREIAERDAQVFKDAQRAAERETLLQQLLISHSDPESDTTRLRALQEAMDSDLITDVDRIDLQLAMAMVLNRLQSFERLRRLIADIQPQTDRQRGQVALWRIRKTYQLSEQRSLARELLQKAPQYELETADVGYLRSLLATSRSEAIDILQQELKATPQHELTRKVLIILLMLEGRTQERDHQIQEARLLFPDDAEVELATGLALAFRSDRAALDTHLQHLNRLEFLSAADREFREKLLRLMANVAEYALSIHVDMGIAESMELVTNLMELLQLASNPSGLPEVFQEAFGAGIGIGLPDSGNASELATRLNSSTQLPMIGFALGLGNAEPARRLISDVERISPIPDDAFFVRLRGYAKVAQNDFPGAATEFETALRSPSVFPRVKARLLYEAGMSHMGKYFASDRQDSSALNRAGELAQRWIAESDELDPVVVQRIQNMLQLNGFYDAALGLIRRYRETVPNEFPPALLHDELNALQNAGRFPELIRRVDELLAGDGQMDEELAGFLNGMRDQAFEALKELVAVRERTSKKGELDPSR